MSSHHIVRDEQEPALFIINSNFNINILHQLLEWSPTLLVHEQILPFITDLGLKVDVIISTDKNTANSIPNTMAYQQPFTLILANEDNYINSALTQLLNKKNSAINILGALSESSITAATSEFSSLKIVNYTNNSAKHIIQKPFSKWLPKGAIFKLIGNVKFMHNNVQYNYSTGLYTVIIDGIVYFNETTIGSLIDEPFIIEC